MSLPRSLSCFVFFTSFGLGVIIRHYFVRRVVFWEGYTFNWGNEVTGGSLEALLQLLPTENTEYQQDLVENISTCHTTRTNKA